MTDDLDETLTEAEKHHRTGDLAAAEAAYRRVLAVDPAQVAALSGLGVLLRATGRLDEAVVMLERAAARAPGDAAVHNNLGNVFAAIGDWDAAVASYRRALDLASDYAEAHANLGRALAVTEDIAGAIDHLRRARTLAPELPGLAAELARHLIDHGNTLFEGDDLETAQAAYAEALEADPESLPAANNLGNTSRALGDLATALDAYDRALAIDGAHAEVRWNRALTLLLAGRAEAGWADYGWRWRRSHDLPLPALPDGQRWTGKGMGGGTLEILDEQGLGDAIQFARYIAAARDQAGAAHVRLRCQAPLVPLLAGLDGVDEVVPREAPTAPFDAYAPLLDLPPLVGLDNVRAVPYLATTPMDLGARTKPRIGLVWAGGTLHAEQHARSLRLDDFRPLLEATNAEFHAFQVGPASAQLGDAAIIDLGRDFESFADTASAVAAMNLVIGVDTAVVHLAGALGKPVWTLLAFVPDWRWGMSGETTPWYPSMRLFRQPSRGDWRSVMAALQDALEAETRLS